MKLFFRKSGNGKPLIILHGLFGLSDNWASLSKKWSEHFTVYAVDLRNHGQSPHSDQWKYWIMAEDVLELIYSEKLDKVNLLGHSMGGKVGMRLALDAPEVMDKLIVSDIAPKKYPVHNQDVVNALLSVKPEKIASRKEAEEILSKKIKDNGTIQFLLKNLYWKEEGENKSLAWRFNLPVIAKNLPVVSDATDSPAPSDIETLFLRGEKSDYIEKPDEAEIKTVFPRATIQTIKDAGHWIHADRPEEMYHAVMKFLM
ncbi:MAG TPA: alpha/beta fold hydrolase [Bacteroidia bacterium]|jgi:pimeloyl-ACP methyl ester carboxylesterase|nr:alpha/beta fold hydrolase [Bacteroidia bacterium]